ncbi:MAG TPA: hypothetical protein VK483_15745 [Chitinophagaceae bacterium]|nr:hypothetical protein [Chitinophagaceae bacterium]
MPCLLSVPYGPVLLLISIGVIIIIVALIKLRQLGIGIGSQIEKLIYSYNIYKQKIKDRKIKKAYDEGIPPVLYLRAFQSDGTKRSKKEIIINDNPISFYKFKDLKINATGKAVSFKYNLERSLAEAAGNIGPFIGIGDPFSNTGNFGAVRLYFSDAEWKQKASIFMEQASLIIVKISGTLSQGFTWEIEEIRRRYLEKTVFCIDIYDKEQYDRFVVLMQKFRLNFPSQFDIFRNAGIYFSFDPNGQYEACAHLDLHNTFLKCRHTANKNKKNIKALKRNLATKG